MCMGLETFFPLGGFSVREKSRDGMPPRTQLVWERRKKLKMESLISFFLEKLDED